MLAPFDYHGIGVVPDDTQARIPGSVFTHVLAAHEQATMTRRRPRPHHTVHLHPLDVERLLAEAP
jgi:hypothetical protein